MGTTQNFQDSLPTFVFNDGPGDWCFFDDFNDLNMSATANVAKWTSLSTDAGNTFTLSGTQSGGVLAATFSTPTDEDVLSLGANAGFVSGTFCKANTPIRFGCRFQLADVSHNDFFVGLSIYDASFAASQPADCVGFRILASEGAGEINLLASKDSVVQMVDPVVITADATWARAFFEFFPTVGNTDSGTLKYTIHHNGSVTNGSLTLANTFPDDVWIAPLVQVQIEGTDGDVGLVDWVYAHAIRADYVDGVG